MRASCVLAAALALQGCRTDDAVLGHGASGPHADAGLPASCHAWNFEDGAGAEGWTHVPLVAGADDHWVRVATREPSCFDGGRCFAVSEADAYESCQSAALVSPVMDLTSCPTEELALAFWHWRQLNRPSPDGDPPDGAFVQLSGDGGSTWHDAPEPLVDPYVGVTGADAKKCPVPEVVLAYVGHRAWGDHRNPGWFRPRIVIPPQFRTTRFRARWVFGAGGFRGARGWIVDDVTVGPHEP